MPDGEKTEGMEVAGWARVPPIAGPMIVPIDQTNGITAYAFAARSVSGERRKGGEGTHAHVSGS